MAGTISPVEVFQNSLSGSESPPLYFVLDFPDFQYPARKLRVVVGRGDESLDTFEENEIDVLNFAEGDDDIIRGQKRSLEESDEDLDSDGEIYDTPAKRRKTATSRKESESEWSSSMDDVPHESRRNHLTAVGGIGGPQIRSENADEDYLGVHPRVDESTGDMPLYAISKRHILIRFDDMHGWLMEVLGRNGIYVNDAHYKPGDRLTLHHRDVLTLKGLEFVFYEGGAMNYDVEHPELSDEEDSDAESELTVESDMSDSGNEDDEEDEDEEMRGVEQDGQTEKQAKVSAKHLKEHAVEEIDEDDGDDGQDNDGQTTAPKSKTKAQKKPRKTIKLTVQATKGKGKGKSHGKAPGKGKGDKGPTARAERPSSVSQPPADSQDAMASIEAQRKRGPGRPPADGIMSKRERKERQRAQEAGIPYGEPLPEKVKNGPRTGSKDDADDVEVDVATTTKKSKKPKRDASGTVEAEEERNESKTPKRETTPEPPKPPSPKESDYPPEALVKPDDTYQGLLYTVLSEAKQPLALPQIYEAIKNKWPHYRFSKETKGWESSVRHNLQSCQCFEKSGKAGKGFLWIINPAVPFERKSKRVDPPNPGSTSYQPHKPSISMMSHPGMHQPVHGLGTHPYVYGQGYPGTNIQQLSFASGPRPQPIQNLQQHPFNGAPSTLPLGQQPRPPQLVNGQRPLLPPHQTLPPHNPQLQPSMNYSSPYAINSAAQSSQPHTPQTPNNGMQSANPLGLQRPPMTQPMPNGVPGRQGQYIPPQPALQRVNPVNGIPPNANSPQSRINSPAPAGQNFPRPGGHLVIEPPAISELRAGRMPAVVKRFLSQLRKISGGDAERTVKQAELAVAWILKHPDSDAGLDREMQEFGAPRSMIDVLRNLIAQQSKSSLDQSALQQRGNAMASAAYASGSATAARPNQFSSVPTSGSPLPHMTTSSSLPGQARSQLPPSAISSIGQTNMAIGQSAQIRSLALPPNAAVPTPPLPNSGLHAQSLPTRSPAPVSTPGLPAVGQQPATPIRSPQTTAGAAGQHSVAPAPPVALRQIPAPVATTQLTTNGTTTPAADKPPAGIVVTTAVDQQPAAAGAAEQSTQPPVPT